MPSPFDSPETEVADLFECGMVKTFILKLAMYEMEVGGALLQNIFLLYFNLFPAHHTRYLIFFSGL
jgi:hypothetical protein